MERNGYKTLWEETKAHQPQNYRLEGRVYVGGKVLSRCLLLLHHVFPIAGHRCEKLNNSVPEEWKRMVRNKSNLKRGPESLFGF